MNIIENAHSKEALEAIVKDISVEVGLEADDYFHGDKFCEMMNCYFLWKVQTDKTIKTITDFDERIFDQKALQFVQATSDELVDFYKNNKDSWSKLLQLNGKYADDVLAECLVYLDYFDDDFFESTPDSICKLVDKFLQINKTDSVLEIHAQGCEYTTKSREQHEGTSYTALSSEYVGLSKGAMVADVLGISNSIILTTDIDGKNYNKVFVNNQIDPAKSYGRFDMTDNVISDELEEGWPEFPVDNSNEWNACGYALINASEKGRVIALMNAGQLTIKQCLKERTFMCQNGCIEGVIMLPNKMYEDTWVNSYLLILSRGNNKVRFYDASLKSETNRAGGKRINILSDDEINTIFEEYSNGVNTVEVNIDDLEKNDFNLNPLRYLNNKTGAVKTIRLGDALIEVKRGMTLSAAQMDSLVSSEPSKKKCIIPASIKGGVITTRLYYHGDIKKPGKNEVFWDEVLLSKTGNPFRSALASEPYLVIGNLYILNVNREMLNPAYLRCFLNSDMGQRELAKYATGSATPIINISDLQKIEIPIFDEAKQDEINQRCEEIVKDLERCYKQIEDSEEEVNDLFEQEA